MSNVTSYLMTSQIVLYKVPNSYHQIYRLIEHDKWTIIPVTRYDKYFSSYNNLKKLQCPPRNLVFL